MAGKKSATRGIKKSSPTAKKAGSSIASKAIGTVAKLAGGKMGGIASTLLSGKKKGGGGFRKAKSAKAMLRKAYERKAIRMLRQGNLGQARRLLRKKATVV